MTLILNNDDIRRRNLKECLEVMEECYLEQAAGRAVNRPTCHSICPLDPAIRIRLNRVDGVGKFGVLALRITSDVVQGNRFMVPCAWKSCRLRNGHVCGSCSALVP
jgi:hypothetical protein